MTMISVDAAVVDALCGVETGTSWAAAWLDTASSATPALDDRNFCKAIWCPLRHHSFPALSPDEGSPRPRD
ncbi:hypothetical protein ACFSLT_19335 [Novosphingobium resinovorum]